MGFCMKAIIGLGNAEAKYMNTRHNTGFMVVDKILAEKNLKLSEKFKSFFVKDNDTLYLLPKTYMNLSGFAVVELMNFYKLSLEDILVIYDDISLPLGTLRFRNDGSDGGHNGIKSVIKETGSNKFARLKVGIGPQPKGVPSEKFVLADFSIAEAYNLQKALNAAKCAALDWLKTDFITLQNLYNKSHV